jgi:drug/metabolite transporter (DMT)-like permease
MGPEALLLVLVAALAHALWNFAAKTVPAGGAVFVHLYLAASALLWVPIAVVWLVVGHRETPEPSWLLGATVSGVLHIVYGLTLQRGYTAADMNVVYPLARGTGPLLTVGVSVLLLGERPPLLALAGALVVVAGVVVIATGGVSGAAPRARRAGLGYGIGTGATIAAYTLWDDHAVNALAVPPLPYFALGLLVQCLVLAPASWRDRERARQVWAVHRRQVVAVAVLSPLAYVLVLQAMRMAPVSLVAPARETSIVVGSLLAWLVLREPHPARRLVGSAVVLIGIAGLVAG